VCCASKPAATAIWSRWWAPHPMLERNLLYLYTGVTRGKQPVVLIGQEKALQIAIRTIRSLKRLTNLSARIRQADKPPGKLETLLSW